MSKKPIVRHVDDIQSVECPCGQSTRIITGKDTPMLSVHKTEISDSKCHYHKIITEAYYILEGKGTMTLNDEQVELYPGLVIYIPPGVRHQVRGQIKTLIMSVPAFDDKDEFFDNFIS